MRGTFTYGDLRTNSLPCTTTRTVAAAFFGLALAKKSTHPMFAATGGAKPMAYPDFIDPEAPVEWGQTESPMAVHDLDRHSQRAARQLFEAKPHGVGHSAREQQMNPRDVTTDRAKVGLMRCASILIVSTYLEDATRMIGAPLDMASYVARSTSLWWPLAAFALACLVLVQLSSLVLLAPVDKHPAIPKLVRYVCGALACTVFAQPLLFNQWSYELLVMSVAQFGALALFYIEAFTVEEPRVAGSPFANYIYLCGRVGLTSDLVLTCGARFLSESREVTQKVFGGVNASELQQVHEQLLERHHETLMKTPADQLGAVEQRYEEQMERIQAMFDEAALFQFHDVHTAFAAALLLAAGILVCLGYRTRYVASLAAFAAFVDASYRFPFFTDGQDWSRFHFFQAMTPVGGLVLIAAFGPGAMSLDAKLQAGKAE